MPVSARRSLPSARSKSQQNGPTSSKNSKAKNVKSDESALESIVFGNLLMKPWYQSYYPEEIVEPTAKQLLVCPFCFKYTVNADDMIVHSASCKFINNPPPGKRVYSSGQFAIYEVDGEDEKLYAQNLSLFGKLFLETKSVFYDVSIFFFYVLVYTGPCPAANLPTSESVSISVSNPESEARKSRRSMVFKNGIGGGVLSDEPHVPRVVGFFSKEKISWDGNNLACILILPPWQSMGFGQILMGASYELSRRDGKPGGPEKPLSELGYRSYLSFWSATIARFLLAQPDGASLSVQDISDMTFILPEDITSTLSEMRVIVERPTSQDGASGSANQGAITRALKVNKALVRAWVQRTKARLEPPISPDGFLIGYTERGVAYAVKARERSHKLTSP